MSALKLNIFKRKRKEEEKKDEKREARKLKQPLKQPEEKAKVKKVENVLSSPIKGKARIAPSVLVSPQITEKASALENLNQYIFRVSERSSKIDIKKAVKELYNVDVLQVRIIKVKRKEKRLGRSIGWKKGYKKAIVKIKKGQVIEILPR